MKVLFCAVVRLYQWTVSPFLVWLGGPGSGCRFEPTCSQYFLEAVQTHGALRGGWLGLKRVCRCHPWGGCGCDPVPLEAESRGTGVPPVSGRTTRAGGPCPLTEPMLTEAVR